MIKIPLQHYACTLKIFKCSLLNLRPYYETRANCLSGSAFHLCDPTFFEHFTLATANSAQYLLTSKP